MPKEESLKYFSPHEASSTLPLVRKIVKDILDCGFEIRTIAESLAGNIEDNPEIQNLNGKMRGFFRELEEIGCQYKDWNFSIGLVDFPSVINGEKVLLCWRSDEEDITYFHGIYDGYAGRKRIPDEYFETTDVDTGQ